MSVEGRIVGIKRFAVHDGDGIRTTVFLKGCPLRCVWCHNPESVDASPEIAYFENLCRGCGACAAACPHGAVTLKDGAPVWDRSRCVACGACASACAFGACVLYGERVDAVTLAERLAEDRAFFETSGGGVTISGGECLTQPAFVMALLRELQQKGISVDVDTCGCVSWETLAETLPYTDVYLYDVKAVDPAVHKKCTGRDNALILDNLRRLSEAGARIEIRYPLVKGWNDGEAEAIARLLCDRKGIVGVRVLKYHDFARSRYGALGKADTMPHTKTEETDMRAAQEILRAHGLRVIEG